MSSYVIFNLLISLLFYNVVLSLRQGPLVETNLGPVKGLKATDGEYNTFLGIPYAEVDKANVFGVCAIIQIIMFCAIIKCLLWPRQKREIPLLFFHGCRI
jgi:hypothetical protein